MTSFCVQRGGGQKGPKICVHTNSILPNGITQLKKGSCNFWSLGVEKTRYVKTKIGAGYELSVLRWAQYRRNLKVKNSGLIWGQSAYFALNMVGRFQAP